MQVSFSKSSFTSTSPPACCVRTDCHAQLSQSMVTSGCICICLHASCYHSLCRSTRDADKVRYPSSIRCFEAIEREMHSLTILIIQLCGSTLY